MKATFTFATWRHLTLCALFRCVQNYLNTRAETMLGNNQRYQGGQPFREWEPKLLLWPYKEPHHICTHTRTHRININNLPCPTYHTLLYGTGDWHKWVEAHFKTTGLSLSTHTTSHCESFKSSAAFWLFTALKISFSFSQTMWGGCLKINRGICLLQGSGHAWKIALTLILTNSRPRVTLAQSENTSSTKIFCLQVDVPLLTQQEKRNWTHRPTEGIEQLKKNLLVHILDLKYYLSIVLGWIWLGLSSHNHYTYTHKHNNS